MTAQNIHRTKHSSDFVVLPNQILTNATLSGNAKALLSYLLSRPAHWTVRIAHLQTILKVGRDRVYRYLRELVAAGYATMTLIQKGVRWQFYDTPQTSPTPDTSGPAPKSHLTETQQAETQRPLERTYTSSLESNYEQQQAATVTEPAKSAEALLVVALPDEIEQPTLITPILNHAIQQTALAPLPIEIPEPTPPVLPECNSAVSDNRANPEIIEAVERLPVTATVKPSLVKTLAALTLVDAKMVLMILTRAISLGTVKNPVGYAVELSKRAKDGSLTVVATTEPLTLSQRLERQERDRQEASMRGVMSTDAWSKMMIDRLGLESFLKIAPWYTTPQ